MLEHFQASDGIRIAYRVDDFTKPWKQADTLVMLHSAMGHAGRYFAMVPPLLPHYRVVRMDLRGHGRSQVPPESPALTMERLVEDVAELMEAIGCASAHFVGNSAGGYVAQNLALTAPEKLKSLSLFGSTPGLKHSNAHTWLPRVAKEGLRPFLADTIAYRFDLERTDPGLVTWFLDEAAKNDTAFVARFIGLMTSLDWSDQVHRIKCPTLLVIPGAETIGGVRNYDSMREHIPDVTVKLYEGMAHNICDSMPEQCARDVLEFLHRRFPEA